MGHNLAHLSSADHFQALINQYRYMTTKAREFDVSNRHNSFLSPLFLVILITWCSALLAKCPPFLAVATLTLDLSIPMVSMLLTVKLPSCHSSKPLAHSQQWPFASPISFMSPGGIC
ncbi:hypothetical protein Tco_1509391 [Tanacetum coccineum]